METHQPLGLDPFNFDGRSEMERSPPLDMPRRRKPFVFTQMTGKDRSTSLQSTDGSSQGGESPPFGPVGDRRVFSRAACLHCNAVFLPSFSAGGSQHCGVDCRTMDHVYGAILRPRGNGSEARRPRLLPPPPLNTTSSTAAAAATTTASPLTAPAILVPPSPEHPALVSSQHSHPEWTSSPPGTRKKSKSLTLVGGTGSDDLIPSPIRAPQPAPLIRKHSGLSLALLNDDNGRTMPMTSPMYNPQTAMQPSFVSVEDMAHLDLRLS